MSVVLSEFSQIANTESKLTTYGHRRGGQLRNELSVSTIILEERLLPQCFESMNDIIIKRVYRAAYMQRK